MERILSADRAKMLQMWEVGTQANEFINDGSGTVAQWKTPKSNARR